jgi:NhaA family Na+:H+ antiporter
MQPAFGFSGEISQGWGIPMATDIAFSLAILGILGKKVPLSLKIFLTALAIAAGLIGFYILKSALKKETV